MQQPDNSLKLYDGKGFSRMLDPFESSRLCLSYARDDIADLDKRFQAFFEAKPYTHFVEHDADAGCDSYKMKFTERLSIKTGRDTARIASEIRAALDQCGYAIAQAAGGRRLKSTYFPFAATEAELDHVIARRCKDIPTDIVTLFRSFKPYPGGDDLLWSINEIANCIKHRFIQPVAVNVGAVQIHRFHSKGVRELHVPPKWDPIKNEVTFCVVEHGAKTQYDMNIGYVVAFGEIGRLNGQSVTNVLTNMATLADSIISATEAEGRRTGLI